MSATVKIVRADRLECRFTPRRWAFDDSRGAEIDAFWRAQTSANPRLYDGPVPREQIVSSPDCDPGIDAACGRDVCSLSSSPAAAGLRGRPTPRRRWRATGGAAACVGAMFGDGERLRLGQIEHLPRRVILRHPWRQRRAAAATDRGVMIDDLVGLGGLPRRLAPAFAAGAGSRGLLPARLLAELSRRLRARAGFFSASLDGGLPLF